MVFRSILFADSEQGRQAEASPQPPCFSDLQLERLIESIIAPKADYQLEPFFHFPLRDLDLIAYRQEVMRDLEKPAIFALFEDFSRKMRDMHRCREQAEKLYYRRQQERWWLDAIDHYCHALLGLEQELRLLPVESRGLRAFQGYLRDYLASPAFLALQRETEALKAALAQVHYCLRIKGETITVQAYAGEEDYSAQIEETFARFKQGAVKDYSVKLIEWQEMNHVEAQILELVARLYPAVFAQLTDYCRRHQHYLDATIATFEREIQFYLAYLDYIAAFRRRGLPFCYPQLSLEDKTSVAEDCFDLALAGLLQREQGQVVCNSFALEGRERLLIVTGPNQGGKTTFARAIGQLHYLAALGCPVPARKARLFLPDRILTHFEREERIENLRGKLEDDLVRLRAMLEEATPASLIILNEIFSATTLEDALFLSRQLLQRLLALDVLAVWVTFLDELASYSEQTVSMVAEVDPEDPARRTFRLQRRPADGLAYALALAQKYRLTYACLKERLQA
ncbi:DNA mismatch repair protein MutS [Thermogemmatispora sp.]|uniref:MutS-related protein n=1 Tax=Thermogemmatispora sp. TaxID=1968838 RepID=UPI0035E42268